MNVLSTIWSNDFDNSIEIAFSQFFDILPSFIKKFIVCFSALNEFGLFFIFIGILFLFIKKTRKLGLLCITSMVITLLFNDLIFKNIFDRSRPYADLNLLSLLTSIKNNDGKLYGIVPTSSSFPSGHTFSAFCVAGAVLFLYLFDKENKKLNLKFMIFFFIYAFIMGLTRILLSHHYTTDVIAGALLGTSFGIATYYLVILGINLYTLIRLKIKCKN